jgi:hypothetical protein
MAASREIMEVPRHAEAARGGVLIVFGQVS